MKVNNFRPGVMERLGLGYEKVREWNPAIVAAMYVLLLPPFTGVTILAIASLGLVDNWIDLRAPLRRTS